MGIPLQRLSLAHGVNRQNGDSLAWSGDGFLSDLPSVLEQGVTQEFQARHFLTDGGLCDNT